MISDSPASESTANRNTISPEHTAEREAFYKELEPFSLKPLWTVLAEALTPEPRVKSVPWIWRWRDVRPRMLRAGELVTAEEAERRVLMLLNPGLNGKIAATSTLFSGVQLILPGEIAPTHHHTPSAIRFIIEGEGGYTTVSGEKSIMKKGDYLTTPNWTWHDHGNETDGPVIWLDGLDIPFVTALDAIFYEEYVDNVQPVSKPREDSIRRWGANLKPTWQQPEGAFSPILNYRWESCRGSLHALRDDKGSPFDGIIMEYINPYNGGPTLPTMSAYLQLLRKGEHTAAHRHVASTVYHVAEGGGYSIIAGKRFDWEEGDTFVVPTWAWHEHASQGGEAVLFSFSDRPILRAFDLDREEAHPKQRQG
jgi:gentisate 1,2-dioxygenase